MWATPIAADPVPWRAMTKSTRQAVRTAARRGLPAPDLDTALAAVGYGRFMFRRQKKLSYALVLVTAGLLCAAPIVHLGLIGLPKTSIEATFAWVVLPAIGIVLTAIGIGLRAARYRRLARRNLPLAATRPTGQPRPYLRIGPRWPGITLVLGALLSVLVLIVGIPLHTWHAMGKAILTVTFFVYLGPSGVGIHAATLDAMGLDLPTWRVRLPWTSVRAVTLDADGLQLDLDGPFEVTGWLPRRWARRVAGKLQPGRTIEIDGRHPELGLWTIQHHLQLAATPASSPPLGH